MLSPAALWLPAMAVALLLDRVDVTASCLITTALTAIDGLAISLTWWWPTNRRRGSGAAVRA